MRNANNQMSKVRQRTICQMRVKKHEDNMSDENQDTQSEVKPDGINQHSKPRFDEIKVRWKMSDEKCRMSDAKSQMSDPGPLIRKSAWDQGKLIKVPDKFTLF